MELIIKPTQRCNFKCTYCSSTNIAKSNKSSDDLDHENILKFLERFPDTRTIIVNGGDPLMMHPDYYYKILDYLDKNEMSTDLAFVTNLWDYYLHPDKWIPVFKRNNVKVCTSFNLGDTRKISKDKVLTKNLFLEIVHKFKADMGYIPTFIAVINEANKDEAIQTVEVAKELGIECSLNYAYASGREGVCFPIGKMYNIYLDVYEADLSNYEFNTRQMLRRLNGDETTSCPQNRSCDEGIRNLQPKSSSGYEYGSCGSFGDDQEYGIDFDKEMSGEFFKPLQSSVELQYQKEECLTCPNFNICNGCFKTVRDLKKNGLVEESCAEMKKFRSRAVALGLAKQQIL